MADSQFIALARAGAGLPTSGVIHLRTRLAADFTVLSNALAQRRGSAVTVGIAAYIQSLPDGAPVSITALCRHFSEGEILISRALRELEADGYLERRRERLPSGQVRTRTYFSVVPGTDAGTGAGSDTGDDPDDDPSGPPKRRPAPSGPPKPPRPGARPEPAPASHAVTPDADATPDASTPDATAPVDEASEDAASQDITAEGTDSEQDGPIGAPPGSEAGKASASPLAGADPRAIAVLCALRTVDSRLVLSAHEAARLAPAVTEWLGAGVEMRDIIRVLTTRLPDPLLTRPVAILSFRLRETPLLAAPLPRTDPADHHDRLELVTLYPFQTCDGCERAFRAPAAGRCRDCRPEEPLLEPLAEPVSEPVPGPLPEPLLAAG